MTSSIVVVGGGGGIGVSTTTTAAATVSRGPRRSRVASKTRRSPIRLAESSSSSSESSSSSSPESASVCSGCGREGGAVPGCDGSGRVIGGLGAVPGFGWWPIKAYRPCEELAKAGKEYKRAGQGIDEVFFGGERRK